MMKTNVVNVKKTTAVVIAFLMMILSVSYSSNKSKAANTARTYRIFNAKTGVQIGNDYTLDALKSEDNSRAVIGEDERKEDYSKKGTVRLIMNDGEYVYHGSGFVVDSHTIATAAHCVYNLKISNIILFDSDKKRSFANPVEYHVPVSYINGEKYNNNDEKYEYDYALITVEQDLSDYLFYDLAVPLDNYRSNINVTGFPGDLGYMCTASGNVTNMNSYKVFYDADTNHGESGGPVYIEETFHNQDNDFNCYSVIAIHTNGGNSGTRITTDLIHFYKQNPNINW